MVSMKAEKEFQYRICFMAFHRVFRCSLFTVHTKHIAEGILFNRRQFKQILFYSFKWHFLKWFLDFLLFTILIFLIKLQIMSVFFSILFFVNHTKNYHRGFYRIIYVKNSNITISKTITIYIFTEFISHFWFQITKLLEHGLSFILVCIKKNQKFHLNSFIFFKNFRNQGANNKLRIQFFLCYSVEFTI